MLLTIEGLIWFNAAEEDRKMINRFMSYLSSESALGLFVDLSENGCIIRYGGEVVYSRENKKLG